MYVIGVSAVFCNLNELSQITNDILSNGSGFPLSTQDNPESIIPVNIFLPSSIMVTGIELFSTRIL